MKQPQPAAPFLAVFDSTPARADHIVLAWPDGPRTHPGLRWVWTWIGLHHCADWRPFDEGRLTKLADFGLELAAIDAWAHILLLTPAAPSRAKWPDGSPRAWIPPDGGALDSAAVHPDLWKDVAFAAFGARAA